MDHSPSNNILRWSQEKNRTPQEPKPYRAAAARIPAPLWIPVNARVNRRPQVVAERRDIQFRPSSTFINRPEAGVSVRKHNGHLNLKATIVRKRKPVHAQVGILVVVDNSIYRQYLKDNGNNPWAARARIHRYYSMVFAMIDQRFGTIREATLSIAVKVMKILIAETREHSDWIENIVDWSTVSRHGHASVHTDNALKEFSRWVSGRTDLPDFDHAMVFTAYRLTNKQGVGLGGMAYLNAVCDTESGNAVSIVVDRGDFQCVKVATHELAHSLGANHDGDVQARECKSDSNYVMSPLTSHKAQVLKNAFYFSPCSIRDMFDHLSKPSSSCVLDQPAVKHVYNLDRLPPGQLYGADKQCQLIFGNKSAFCRESGLVDIMCGQLWCTDPEKENGCRTNSYLTALPGTECGYRKICLLGECVAAKKADVTQRSHRERALGPAKPSSRMAGPRRRRRYRKKSHSRRRPRNRRRRRRSHCSADKNPWYCRGLLQLNPGGCRRPAIRQYCCHSCRRYMIRQ